MKLHNTKLEGVKVIELQPYEDERGSLVRIWDKQKLSLGGEELELVQGYITFSKQKGTLRGIHYQVPPRAETKLNKCIRGSVYELAVDMRPDSKTYKQYLGMTFKADDNQMLLVPENCGHAILTLEDNTEFMSFSTTEFSPEHEKGVRYDDPGFNFDWPIDIEVVSDKDLAWEDFKE